MAQAIGVLETCGIPSALVSADIMAKAAAVQVIGIENTASARMSVVIKGNTGAVETALAVAVAELAKTPGATVLGHHFLPCPAGAVDNVRVYWQASDSPNDEFGWLDD